MSATASARLARKASGSAIERRAAPSKYARWEIWSRTVQPAAGVGRSHSAAGIPVRIARRSSCSASASAVSAPMSATGVLVVVVALDDGDDLVDVDRAADLDQDLRHRPVAAGADGVLHLHGLDHHHRVALGPPVARG